MKVIESEKSFVESIFERLKEFWNEMNRLENEIKSIRTDSQTNENVILKELKVHVENQNLELSVLKESVNKLNPPSIVGGFKSSDSIQFFVPGSSPLCEGIIYYLTRQCGGNVCDRQCIHVFFDSVYDASYQPKNVTDLSTDTVFLSENNPNQSIGYDFKDNQRISPTHYAIRSAAGWSKNFHHPKSWVIEVTNDRSNGNSWIEIDRRENNQDLNGPGIIQTFVISRPPNGEFRFIRFRQINTNHVSYHHLAMTAFELFGQLRIRTATHR
jgi:hypothetical protein